MFKLVKAECSWMKKVSLTHFFQFIKETKLVYEIPTFVSAICFLGSYFLFYKPTMECVIYPFNPGTAILFALAFVSSSITVILIIKERHVTIKTLLIYVIHRSFLFILGILTRLGFIQYQRQGCGNIHRWYVYFIDAYLATVILELIIILLVVFIANRTQSRQNDH